MLSRLYPKATRMDSSNYSPMPFWNVGSQIVALNYQTPDKNLQINEAKFLQNGKSGYVLKPSYMRKTSDYNPSYCSLSDEDPVSLVVKIIAARHLTTRHLKSKRGIVSPYVKVEVIGCNQDSISNKHTSKTIPDNGLNPFWDESFQLGYTSHALLWLFCGSPSTTRTCSENRVLLHKPHIRLRAFAEGIEACH